MIKIPGLTDAEVSDSCHWLGIGLSIGMAVWGLTTGVIAFVHNLHVAQCVATVCPKVMDGWVPPPALVALAAGLIAGGIWNSKANT